MSTRLDVNTEHLLIVVVGFLLFCAMLIGSCDRMAEIHAQHPHPPMSPQVYQQKLMACEQITNSSDRNDCLYSLGQ